MPSRLKGFNVGEVVWHLQEGRPALVEEIFGCNTMLGDLIKVNFIVSNSYNNLVRENDLVRVDDMEKQIMDEVEEHKDYLFGIYNRILEIKKEKGI